MVPIEQLSVSAFRVPTESPESDGTFAWDATTMVIAEVSADGRTGIGYSYTDVSAAVLIDGVLRKCIERADALSTEAIWQSMVGAVRNLGVPGIAATAISAVDSALWDLKAKLLDLSVLSLLGGVRGAVPVYGSGGFTSYSVERLQAQLAGWANQGIARVKMKVGRNPADDAVRVQAARDAIGPSTELFVDANGAYTRKQALGFAETFSEYDVTWFEEPVESKDLKGLRLLRDRGPAGMAITAGEYGYDVAYFQRMLEAGAVDVLQADATRCLGITGFLKAADLCEAFTIPLSAHTAPALHAQPCCAKQAVVHVEYFYDHARIESMFFDDVVTPHRGALEPDGTRPGTGLELKRADAAPYCIWRS